jgi:hypothetical protein
MPTFRPPSIPQLPSFPSTHRFRVPAIPRPRRPSFATEYDLDSLSEFSSEYSSSHDEYDLYDYDDEYDDDAEEYVKGPISTRSGVEYIRGGGREEYAPRPAPRPTPRPAPRVEGTRVGGLNPTNPTGKAYKRPDFDNRI